MLGIWASSWPLLVSKILSYWYSVIISQLKIILGVLASENHFPGVFKKMLLFFIHPNIYRSWPTAANDFAEGSNKHRHRCFSLYLGQPPNMSLCVKSACLKLEIHWLATVLPGPCTLGWKWKCSDDAWTEAQEDHQFINTSSQGCGMCVHGATFYPSHSHIHPYTPHHPLTSPLQASGTKRKLISS